MSPMDRMPMHGLGASMAAEDEEVPSMIEYSSWLSAGCSSGTT